MATINIGILAHVDAGKTSLTERILFETGVIAAIGRVDHGNTHTDTLDIERERGITIKSAVVSLRLRDLKVNLIDTPGHADFIAEVERSLRVLDAVILVVSAVEGVQAQTRRLARAVQAAGLPMLLFINKIDRVGARGGDLLADIHTKMGLRVIPINGVSNLGTRQVEVHPIVPDDAGWWSALTDLLAESSDALLAAYLDANGSLPRACVQSEYAKQIADGRIVPAFFGSAMTGAGVSLLLDRLPELLPAAPACSEAPLQGSVFKIQRTRSGEKIAFVRLFAGRIDVRQRVPFRRTTASGECDVFDTRITGIERFDQGRSAQAQEAVAGDIVCLHGIKEVQIGDELGDEPVSAKPVTPAFSPPSLISVVRAVDPAQNVALAIALQQLTEQDPLISLRAGDHHGEMTLRLFGEVQKEVIGETLLNEFGVHAHFEESQTLCIERPIGWGAHCELISAPDNPFEATVGFGSNRPSPAAASATTTVSARCRSPFTGRSRRQSTKR